VVAKGKEFWHHVLRSFGFLGQLRRLGLLCKYVAVV